ncbi:MAG: cytochrome c [Acidobacteria bacterium]|nr:cytochrome c [Acidobacteriota bacterium]
MRGGLNLLLSVVLVALVGAYAGINADPNVPNWEFLPNMVRSIPADAFAPSPLLPGGRVLQPPPPGTIPRGLPPLPYTASPEDAARAGVELTNPYTAEDPAALARGGTIYANYCAVCHGAAGLGDGPVTLRGVPPPPSYAAENALKLTDGQMFHILTYGQKNMASYATQVSREDRWKVILHVRLLQQRAAAQAAAQAAPPLAPATPPSPPQ